LHSQGLGFLSISADAKVQLTSKWSPPPAPTASLISIASRKGLVAAAGPDALHIATTESVRKAFESDKSGDSEVRSFTPQAKVPFPIRISQLAFTADEQYLILSAESGGGLAVYDVQALTQGATQPAFELSTNQETLRALVPNPMPESAGLCATVTNNGNLFMANLGERKLVSGSSGPTLRSQVSCAAWSTKGKQLVAGLADGSISQMTPDGAEKAHIPKPPGLGDYYGAFCVCFPCCPIFILT
jgi:nucleoporin NUP159